MLTLKSLQADRDLQVKDCPRVAQHVYQMARENIAVVFNTADSWPSKAVASIPSCSYRNVTKSV